VYLNGLNPTIFRRTMLRGKGAETVAPRKEQRVERRLAAIFAADVASYSRLVGLDEAGTLRTLAAHREVMDRLIADHGGRIANTAGDSVLAEFPSVVDAVQCAVAVQEKLAETSGGAPEDRRLKFRIGVHVGDVVVRGGDLLGEGVNVAARLEGLAEPGGIAISGTAHGYVRKALPLVYVDLGEQHVKNLEEPLHAYAVTPADTCPAPTSTKPLALPGKPSIAVLPFTNMSGDPEQEYFTDGITEDLITALSRIRWLFVIARNSSFVFKNRAVDIKEVGEKLGVRYILEGSVRKAGDRVRITGQLIEAATGAHIWADRHDGKLADIFELQDEITQQVVVAIEPRIQSREIERARSKATENLDAYDTFLRALPELYLYSVDGFRTAEGLLRKALELDPTYSDAWAALTDCLGRLHVGGWVENADQSRRAIQDAAALAVRHDPDNGSALAIAAWAHALVLGQIDRAVEYAYRALRLHPNSAYVRSHCGWPLVLAGQIEPALEQFQTARRFSPLDPRGYTTDTGIAACHFFAERFEHAVEWATRVRSSGPNFPVALRFLAAAYGHLGRLQEAREVVEQLLVLQPNSTVSRARASSFAVPSMVELFAKGLERAGLPQ
jgi:adenylate cyclase